MDRFSDFKLGMGIEAEKDWRSVRRPQVAMHSQLPGFLVSNCSDVHVHVHVRILRFS